MKAISILLCLFSYSIHATEYDRGHMPPVKNKNVQNESFLSDPPRMTKMCNFVWEYKDENEKTHKSVLYVPCTDEVYEQMKKENK